MPDAIRKEFGRTAVGFDKDYPTTTECSDPALGIKGTKIKCPAIIDIKENPSLDTEKVVELLNQAADDMLGLAWLRLAQGISDEQLFQGSDYINSLKPFLEQYQEAKQANGGKLRIEGILAFTDEDGYVAPTSTYVDTDYKVEWIYLSQPNKYTPISVQSQVSVGIIVNHDSKIVTLTMYDLTGGRGSLQNDLSIKYQTANDMVSAGIAFADKTVQLNGKFDFAKSYDEVRPALKGIGAQLQKSLAPIPDNITIQGKNYTYYQSAVNAVSKY
jgi:hypothetical protein